MNGERWPVISLVPSVTAGSHTWRVWGMGPGAEPHALLSLAHWTMEPHRLQFTRSGGTRSSLP